MTKVSVRIEKSPDGDWWVSSTDIFGFFAVGETREEALQNAREALALQMNCDENELNLTIENE